MQVKKLIIFINNITPEYNNMPLIFQWGMIINFYFFDIYKLFLKMNILIYLV